MGRKRRKQKPGVEEVIQVGGFGFRFEKEVGGCRCTHFLFRSVNGGYLVSFTNVDVELGEVGAEAEGRKKGWMQ